MTSWCEVTSIIEVVRYLTIVPTSKPQMENGVNQCCWMDSTDEQITSVDQSLPEDSLRTLCRDSVAGVLSRSLHCHGIVDLGSVGLSAAAELFF